MSDQLLPLFPLPLVLFPDSSLPLHIFEERYKILIRECIEGRKEFGVNLMKDSTISDIGCAAVVASQTRSYDDGRMDITVRGSRRYELRGYETHRAPYLVGHVSFLADEGTEVDEVLARNTVRLYNELVAVVYKDEKHRASVGSAHPALSFALAQKAGMDIPQRQRLLELNSENERLQLLYSYLEEVVPKLKQFEEVERVIRSDGYL